ncbi:DUF2500 domain-containing protein [Neobacillus sp. PS2-9]|uniref:DUF2500 domain-containing protein n=1 Tax=Neobacillus sp. PS2-9 TaxID=3070676 RepID=UPI0027E163D9|nr:DUF2500 domain-containing protein [Neobacillus sp. PS2-9]WML56093.1 DUF2500 domain-containing protein [Neobacillus sp. PS2-9]
MKVRKFGKLNTKIQMLKYSKLIHRRGLMMGVEDLIFHFGPIFIGIIFVIVISTILVTLIKSITQWNKDNHSPKLKVQGKMVAKRTTVQGGEEHRAYSDYFVTFEVESGDRMEMKVNDTEYGMLVEGNYGELAFHGSRYLSFIRTDKNIGSIIETSCPLNNCKLVSGKEKSS